MLLNVNGNWDNRETLRRDMLEKLGFEALRTNDDTIELSQNPANVPS
tara:strand:+ start:326 stop:466 length:141 start_codon:yes stop_codon:yes gene_type:complete